MAAIREQIFIREARQASRKVWEGIQQLLALQTEWNALDYGTTLDAGDGENAGVAGADVGSVLFDTANALKAVLNAGHATNMAKLL